jgi:hypothetical protein
MRRIDSPHGLAGADDYRSRGIRGGGRPPEAKDLESGIALPPLKKRSAAAAGSHNEIDFLSQPQLHVHGASNDSAGESTLHPLATYPSGRGSENFCGGSRSSI